MRSDIPVATVVWALAILRLAHLALAYWWKVAAVAPVVRLHGVVAQPLMGPQGWEAQDLLEKLGQVWAVSHTIQKREGGKANNNNETLPTQIPSPMDNTQHVLY